MFFISPQPHFYRPTYYSRPRTFARPSYCYWQPYEFEEPSITWVIQHPAYSNNNETVPSPQASQSKPEANDESTVVHRNTAVTTTTTTEKKPFSVQVKLPNGLSAENLQVRVKDNVLFITGEKRVARDNFVRTTSFARQFPVQADVDTDNMSAVINPNGVLVITAPTKTNNSLPSSSDPSPTETATTESKEAGATVGASEPPTSTTTSTDVAEPEAKPTAVEPKQTVSETKPIVSSDEAQPPVLVPFKLQVTQNDDKAFAVTVVLPPGVTANDIDLQVSKGGVLSISGEQRKEYNGSVMTSKFVRHFALEKNAEVDKITATLDDQTRVLTVTVPKKPIVELPTVQKIAIHVGGAPSSSTSSATEEPKVEENQKDESPLVDQTATEEKSPSDETSSSGSKDESWTDVEKTHEEAENVDVQVESSSK